MVKNIVFDIGNVLADYRLKEFLLEKGFDGPMIRRILKASIMSPYWEQFERDEIDEDQALDAFSGIDPEIRDELKRAFSDVHGMLTIREFAVEWLKNLKLAGYRVYYLSNYSKKAFHECSDSLSFMNEMDGGLLSFQAHMTKPDPRFYQLFLEKYDLKAEECVFIDDTKDNVVEAERQGFIGIVYENCEQAMRRLDEICSSNS